MEHNLTTGSVPKTILYFSLPYFLSYFLQTLYGTADLFIIGQFNGVDSTTAVSIGSQVMHMLTVMIVGLAMGTTVKMPIQIPKGAAVERFFMPRPPRRPPPPYPPPDPPTHQIPRSRSCSRQTYRNRRTFS